MTSLTIKEATSLIHSYGLKCNSEDVLEWLKNGTIKSIVTDGVYLVTEDELHNFLHRYRWQDTAYEEGISDKVKIERLLEEIGDLKKQIQRLKDEKEELENQLEVMPF